MSVPILGDVQIVNELTKLGIDNTEVKLAVAGKGPGFQQAFQQVLWQFVEKILQFDSEWLEPYNNYVEGLQHPEVYDDAWRTLNLFHMCKDVLKQIGVNLAWMDFCEPSTTVIRKVFSTCVAFAKYVQWKEPDVAAAERRVDAVLEENRENQERIDVLRREYDMACNDKEDKELQLEGLAAQVAEEQLRLDHLIEESDALRNQQMSAQKLAVSARSSLLVRDEKLKDSQAALQEVKSELCEDADALMAEYNAQLRLNEDLDAKAAAEVVVSRLLRRNFSVMDKAAKEVQELQQIIDGMLEARVNKKSLKAELAAVTKEWTAAGSSREASAKAKDAAASALKRIRERSDRMAEGRAQELDLFNHNAKIAEMKSEAAAVHVQTRVEPKMKELRKKEQQILKSIDNVEKNFGAREQWLQEVRQECIDDVAIAGENSIASIREYANKLEAAAKRTSEDPVEERATCERLRALCDRLDALDPAAQFELDASLTGWCTKDAPVAEFRMHL